MLALLLALALPMGQQAAPAGQSVHVNLSPAGEATVKQYMSTEDPKLIAMAKELQSIAAQLDAVQRAPKLDMVKLEALVHRQEQLENSVRVTANARLIAMLKSLSDSDRSTFMRTLANARRAGAQGQAGQR
jgi:hypothetical protein